MFRAPRGGVAIDRVPGSGIRIYGLHSDADQILAQHRVRDACIGSGSGTRSIATPPRGAREHPGLTGWTAPQSLAWAVHKSIDPRRHQSARPFLPFGQKVAQRGGPGGSRHLHRLPSRATTANDPAMRPRPPPSRTDCLSCPRREAIELVGFRLRKVNHSLNILLLHSFPSIAHLLQNRPRTIFWRSPGSGGRGQSPT